MRCYMFNVMSYIHVPVRAFRCKHNTEDRKGVNLNDRKDAHASLNLIPCRYNYVLKCYVSVWLCALYVFLHQINLYSNSIQPAIL